MPLYNLVLSIKNWALAPYAAWEWHGYPVYVYRHCAVPNVSAAFFATLTPASFPIPTSTILPLQLRATLQVLTHQEVGSQWFTNTRQSGHSPCGDNPLNASDPSMPPTSVKIVKIWRQVQYDFVDHCECRCLACHFCLSCPICNEHSLVAFHL